MPGGSNLGQAVLKLVTDAKGLTKGLTNARKHTDAATGKMSRAFASVTSSVRDLAGEIPVVGGVLEKVFTPGGAVIAGVGALTAGIAASVVEVVNLEKELRPMIQRSGLAAESLQTLTEAAKRTGSEDGLEGVADSSQELQLRLAEAASGSESMEERFAALGLSSQELIRLSPEQAFLAVITAIQGVNNEAQRKFHADELMGGSSEKLAGIINLTSQEFQALQVEVKETTRILSQETLDQAREFDLAMRDLNASLDEAQETVGSRVIPRLTNLVQAINDNDGAVGSAAGKFWEANDAFEGLLGNFKDGPVTIGAITALFRDGAVEGENYGGVMGDMAAAVMETSKAHEDIEEPVTTYADKLAEAIEKTEAANEALREESRLAMDVAASYGELPSVITEVTEATDELTEASEGLAPAMTTITEAGGEMGQTLQELEEEQRAAAAESGLMEKAINSQRDAYVQWIEDFVTGSEEKAEAAEEAAEREAKAAEEAAEREAKAARKAAEAVKLAAESKAAAIDAAKLAVAAYERELEIARIEEGNVEAATKLHEQAVIALDAALTDLNLVMADNASSAEDISAALVTWETAVNGVAAAQRTLETATRNATEAIREQKVETADSTRDSGSRPATGADRSESAEYFHGRRGREAGAASRGFASAIADEAVKQSTLAYIESTMSSLSAAVSAGDAREADKFANALESLETTLSAGDFFTLVRRLSDFNVSDGIAAFNAVSEVTGGDLATKTLFQQAEQMVSFAKQFGDLVGDADLAEFSRILGGITAAGERFGFDPSEFVDVGFIRGLIGLSSGGITTRDTVARLHANEAVIPLDRLASVMAHFPASGMMQHAYGGDMEVASAVAGLMKGESKVRVELSWDSFEAERFIRAKVLEGDLSGRQEQRGRRGRN